MANEQPRDQWVGKLGIMLAVAGSAIGLGNFLRFPSIAASNGGGAFMIPYFVAFLLVGLPVCWVEWVMGRYGGQFSHGSGPGIFDAVCGRRPWAKYLGVLGVVGPMGIFFYYVVVESWTLAYSVFSLLGRFRTAATPAEIGAFFGGFVSGDGGPFAGRGAAYAFFLATFLINFWVVYHGITKGIDAFCKVAVPLLFLIAVVLMVRVFTLGAPLAGHPDWNVPNGLGFLWNPDFSKLGEPRVWLSAAGQIFFSLSVGIGVILTYASYLKSRQDVALSSTTAAFMNEVAEVVMGGSIVVTAAFCFLGPAGTGEAVAGGTFGLAFRTTPLVFARMPAGELFGFYWFALLFVAGITSSISLLQPVVSFLEEELGLRRRQAVVAVGAVAFVVAHLAIFGDGVIDEMDFWFSSFGLPFFGLLELLVFLFVFGPDRGWRELHAGAEMRVPRAFYWITRYVTPVVLAAILLCWLATDGWKTIILRRLDETGRLVPLYTPQQVPWVWTTRLLGLGLVATAALLVRWAWRHGPPARRPTGERA